MVDKEFDEARILKKEMAELSLELKKVQVHIEVNKNFFGVISGKLKRLIVKQGYMLIELEQKIKEFENFSEDIEEK